MRICSDPVSACGCKGPIYHFKMPVLNINFAVSPLKWFRVRHLLDLILVGLAVAC